MRHFIHELAFNERMFDKFSIASQLKHAHAKVAVIGVGVSGRNDYETRILTVLNAWASLDQKPALLIATHEPAVTNKIIEKWSGWHDLPAELREAVQVNQVYFSESHGTAAADVQKMLDVSKKLKLLLSSQQAPDTVHEPDIAGAEKTLARGA